MLNLCFFVIIQLKLFGTFVSEIKHDNCILIENRYGQAVKNVFAKYSYSLSLETIRQGTIVKKFNNNQSISDHNNQMITVPNLLFPLNGASFRKWDLTKNMFLK